MNRPMTRVPARAADLAGAFLSRAGLLMCLLAISALLVPATALAGVAPTVHTGYHYDDTTRTETVVNPQATTSSQELVFGWINPRGLSTNYSVEYAVSTDVWCTSGGSSGSPQTTASTSVGFTDSNPHNLSLAVPGLTSGTEYCAALSATNGAGTTVGAQVTFWAGLPTVTTTTATPTGVQQAAVQGTVDPATQATTYWVVWDLASSTWCMSDGASGAPSYFTTTSTTVSQQDAVAHNVTVNISDQTASTPLQPNTKYCAAIAAGNPSSSTAGVQVYGTTAPATTFTTEQAVASTSIQSTSATTAQLAGFVNPDGATTTYFAAYAPVSSDWCQTDEASGSPSTTTPQTLNAQDESGHNVTVNITGLTTGESYCVSLESDNTPLGVSDGGELPDQTLTPLPPPFTAGLPTATTLDVNPDSPTAAKLDGTVGPSGQATTYYAVYDLQNSTWCESNGETGTPSYSSTPAALAQSDSGTYNVSVKMTGLTPGAQYCVAMAADNSSNGESGSPSQTIGGTPQDFTAGIAPGAGYSDIVDQTPSSSVVSGTANAEGQTTTYQVAYDTAGSRWCNGEAGSPAGTTTGVTLPSADTSDQPVSVSLTGLTSGTTYCEAIVATNQSGSATGPQMQFVAGLPTAAMASSTTSGDTSETLVGAVTPTTQATSYYVAYDAASAAWCQSGGDDPSGATYASGHVELGAIDNLVHTVSVTLTGLAPGENYCAEFVAVNDGNQVGTYISPSAQLGFTAGYPFTATTTSSQGVTDTSATIHGTVNPAGLATSYWVAYDLADSPWCSSQGYVGQPGYSSTPISLPQTDRLSHSVSAAVSGLLPGTSYCAAIFAQNDEGTVAGTQVSFTTVSDGSAVAPTVSPAPAPPAAGPPSHVTVQTVSMTSPHGVRIVASINPGGQSTTYHAAYAPANSPFCVGGGTGAGSSTTATQALSATDSSTHQVTIQIAGLAAATRYCAKVVAENASGTTESVIKVFTTISDPRLSDLRLSPKAFVTHAPPNAILRAGTRVSFRDSQAGRVTFVVTTHRRGRAVVIGRFSHSTPGGLDSFTFSGKVAGKPLPRGRYALEATATDRWGLSSAGAKVDFKVM
jgi:hypothetical protein